MLNYISWMCNINLVVNTVIIETLLHFQPVQKYVFFYYKLAVVVLIFLASNEYPNICDEISLCHCKNYGTFFSTWIFCQCWCRFLMKWACRVHFGHLEGDKLDYSTQNSSQFITTLFTASITPRTMVFPFVNCSSVISFFLTLMLISWLKLWFAAILF